MTIRNLTLALGISLIPSFLGAAQGPPPTALLRVHASFNYGGQGTTSKDQEIFVTTARLVTATLTSNVSASPWSAYWFVTTGSRVARKSDFAALQRALAEDGIASQEGDCSVTVHVVPTAGFYDITWFNGSQRKTLHVDIDGATPACPPEIAAMVNSINNFARSAGFRDFGIPVE